MSPASPSVTLSKLRQEVSIFDSKDRLLSFSAKGDFQSPLIMEAGDAFYEKWTKSNGTLPLESFFPISQNYTAQQKLYQLDAFSTVLREKAEDFGETDLYLVLGFLKWDGNALAPSLLVPLDVDNNKQALTLSKRPPIENVVLRERLKDVMPVALPKADDAIIDGQFNIKLYYSLFEKAVATTRNWKFTRHGLCLGFFNTGRLLMRNWFESGFQDKKVDGNKNLSALLTENGFEAQESLFEEGDFDHIYSPADFHFPYVTDSHTSKVTLDALNEKALAYAVQALPGTDKYKVATNIVAESVAKGKKVLVVNRRTVSADNFKNSWKPPFRTFPKVDRDDLKNKLSNLRQELVGYYDTVNKPLSPTGVLLGDLLEEFSKAKAPKKKLPEAVFQGVSQLSYPAYQELKSDLQELIDLYFNKNGVEVKKAFQDVNVTELSSDQKEAVAKDLDNILEQAKNLEKIASALEASGLYPSGVHLSGIAETIKLIQQNFENDTPTFEQWELRSDNWDTYKDTLLALPDAGSKWVNFRRQTSDTYIDNAVDENILSARNDFAESQKIALKGLSDRYRSSKRKLLKVLRNPKAVESDAQLLELIDTLLTFQENKKAYKDSAVLGNRLLGKDWLYERSNWDELDKKIKYIFEFRKKYKGTSKFEPMLRVLEQWHLFKDLQSDFQKYQKTIANLVTAVQNISKELQLKTSLEKISINQWVSKIQSWKDNWDYLDIHVQLTALFKKIETLKCPGLLHYITGSSSINQDFEQMVVHYWVANQIQTATKNCPSLFAVPPKARAKKSKEYKDLLDRFCNANFRELHESIEGNEDLLTVVHLNDTYRLAGKHFDLAVVLDADSISTVEALPSIMAANRLILIGDPHNPSLEKLPFDAYQEAELNHTPLFHDSILATTLRKGIPTRELWLSSHYADATLVDFANKHIYNGDIKQFPIPSKEQFKGLLFKAVPNKVLAISQAAIKHAEKNPGKTLGIIAFHQSTCHEIESTIRAMLMAGTPAARFFDQQNLNIRYFVKTPERSVDRYRDTILICAEAEGVMGLAGDRKMSVCTTLAKSETHVFISESDLAQKTAAKQSIFWEWISYLQTRKYQCTAASALASSPIRSQVIESLKAENILVEEAFSRGGINIGPVIVDANNPKRFLALVEDDCTTERFRNSIEDRDYIRPTLLKQLGWKVLSIWLPFWYMAKQDETSHLIATIVIEQSVAPPPPTEPEETENEESNVEQTSIVIPYQVQHPKIEGTPHDKPIAELPTAALITQVKFYVDHEAPIHQDVLKKRILELHHVDRAGPIILKAFNEAINQGLQKKRFVKTGPFFYSLKPMDVAPRDRSARPDSERKLAYVAPEERTLMPATMDEHSLKLALGLLE